MNKQEYEVKAKDLQYKNLSIQIKATDDEKGIVEAIVSCFGNVDSYGEIVDRGAFLESLNHKYPKGVWMHDWTQPVAKTLEARETDEGLYIKGQFNLETQRGKEAYSDVKFGTIDEFSIGYSVLEDELDMDGYRHLKKLKLYEWSPVLVGANPSTQVLGVKAAQKTADGQAEPENTENDENIEKDEKECPATGTEANPEATEQPENDGKGTDGGNDPEQPENETESEKDHSPTPPESGKDENDDEKGEDFKEGRALSESNRALITDVVVAINQLKGALKSAVTPLTTLLEATSKGQKKVEAESTVQPKSVLRLRQTAKEAQKACEAILRITRD